MRMAFSAKCLLPGMAFVVLLASIPGSAQSPQASKPQETLQYEVSVTLKLLQVYVADKKGMAVRDLTKDDFAILDNGKPVSITDFEVHELGPATGEIEARPGRENREATTAQPIAINRKFFILFDFAFNNPNGIMAGVQASLHFLDKQVMPGDEVALLTYSSIKGLRVREYLTTDVAKVRAAVSAVTAKEIAGRADEIEYEYWQLAGGSEGTSPAQKAARLESRTLAGNYLRNLTSVAKALRLVQGQKCFLFFSTGIPSSMIYGGNTWDTGAQRGPVRGYSAATAGRAYSEGVQFEVADAALQPLQEEMLKEFSSTGCAFYVFDTRESSKMTSLFGYDQRIFDVGVGGIFSQSGVHDKSNDPFINDKVTGLDTLKRMSKQTGGQFFSNIALYEKSLAALQETTAAYYVLGYAIPSAADGRYHEVDVKVKRPGLSVRTQPGYFNPKPFREYSNVEKDVHLFDLALNRRSETGNIEEFPATALVYDAGEGTRVRAIARMPRRILTGLGGGESEIVTLFLDGEDNVLSLQRATRDVSQAAADLVFTAGHAPKPGPVRCRVIVRNLETGRSAVGAAAAYVPAGTATGGAGLTLSTPLLLVASGGSQHLDGTVKGRIDALSWRDIYLYDERRYSPIMGEVQVGEEAVTPAVTAIVPFSLTGPAEHNVSFSANLVDSETAQSIPLAVKLRDKNVRGAVNIQMLEIPLDGVKTGRYLLYFHANDKTTGAAAHAHVPLVVKR